MHPTRLCVNDVGASIEKRKDGHFEVTGFINFQVDLLKSLLDIPELLNFTLVSVPGGDSPCINSFVENKTDIAFGLFQMDDLNEHFHVPVINSASSILIMSGYEVNNYIESQKNKSRSIYGLVDNISLYDWQTYLSMSAFLLTFVLTYAMFLRAENQTRANSRRVRSKFLRRSRRSPFRHLQRCLVLEKTKWKSLSFVFVVAVFLVRSPFFLLFNTSQVVTERPIIISELQSVMSMGVACWHGDGNFDTLIEPNPNRRSSNDLTSKFWNYFKENRYSSFSKPKSVVDYLEQVYTIAKKIVNKEIVYVTQTQSIVLVHTLSCVVSRENEYFRTFYFKDDSSREILTGSAFRRGFTNPLLVKMLKWKFEDGISMPLALSRPKYDFSLPLNSTTRRHRREQLELCLDKNIVAYQRETTYSSDVSFFLAFWLISAALFILDYFVLVAEIRRYLLFKQKLESRKLRVRLLWSI